MTEPTIRLTDLRFAWLPRGPLVLDIPAFEVAPGEHVFLHGPSGSGKTTLLNLLGGVTVPQDGRVEVLGHDLAGLSGPERDRFRSDHVGFVFQLFNLVPYLGLVDNVTLPCRFSATRRDRARVRSGSAEAEARRLLGRMQLDVDRLSGRAVAELSVGQQQRVAAARALIGGPGLVIADEPTSALDDRAAEAFLGLFFDEAAAAGATLLFVSHDRALEPMFRRTVALADINRAAGGG